MNDSIEQITIIMRDCIVHYGDKGILKTKPDDASVVDGIAKSGGIDKFPDEQLLDLDNTCEITFNEKVVSFKFGHEDKTHIIPMGLLGPIEGVIIGEKKI